MFMKKLMSLTILALCSVVAFAAGEQPAVSAEDVAQYGEAAPIVYKLRESKKTPFNALETEFRAGVPAEKADVSDAYKGFIFSKNDLKGHPMYLYGAGFEYKMPPSAVVVDEFEKTPFRLIFAFHNKMEKDAFFSDTSRLQKYFNKHALEMTPVAKYRDSLYTRTLDGSEEILVRKSAAAPEKLLVRYKKNGKIKAYGFTFVKGVL